jgi:hypothetical protein
MLYSEISSLPAEKRLEYIRAALNSGTIDAKMAKEYMSKSREDECAKPVRKLPTPLFVSLETLSQVSPQTYRTVVGRPRAVHLDNMAPPAPVVEHLAVPVVEPLASPVVEATTVQDYVPQNSYIEFGKSIHAQLKAKYPTFTPQQVITEKARLWNIKKANPAITNKELLDTSPDLEEVSKTDATGTQITSSKKKSIPKYIKTLVWNTHIGETVAQEKCLCCKVTTINMRHFDCGHVIAEKHGGSLEVSNLRPICKNCNSAMGTTNMDEFIKMFGI